LQVAEEFRGDIQSDIDTVSQLIGESEAEERAVDEQHAQFVEGVRTAERTIQERSDALKQLIDRQADRLKTEVNTAKQQREEEVARRKEAVELNRLVLHDFQKYSQQVKDKGKLG